VAVFGFHRDRHTVDCIALIDDAPLNVLVACAYASDATITMQMVTITGRRAHGHRIAHSAPDEDPRTMRVQGL